MKGVSDNNAQGDKPLKGNKVDFKKPIQVLKLNKKDSHGNIDDKNIPNQNDQKDNMDEAKLENDYIEKHLPELTSLDSPVKKETKALELGSNKNELAKPLTFPRVDEEIELTRTVDEFDFDENQFLAALNENEPIGSTGETIQGKVIALESDGLYVDIGGKAPGFMPKKECCLGVITNFKEKFPIGLTLEVLVIKEQNADGMVTVSARALILRKSWEKVSELSKNGDLIEVLVNGFNRGGLTCDVDGLRGFIPRSQLEEGNDYQSLVGKTIKVAFLEVNPESRKLVLSEKKAILIAKFSELKLGQLIEGEILAVKPYGFFVDLGGASGLLHQSSVTKGSMRNLREVFVEGELIKALITEIDLEKGRIGLDTALLENTAGELLVDKEKVMLDAHERAKKIQSIFNNQTKQ